MKTFFITICLALVATAANAQTITDALRRDQQGQGKVVVNQSADIERLVNNRQQQTTTTTNTPQNVKPVEKQNNQQQTTKPATTQQTKPITSQQGVKSNPSQEKNTTTQRQTEQRQNNYATQRPSEQHATEQHQTERNNASATERPSERQTERPSTTTTERSTERQTTTRMTTERPTTSYNNDYDAPAVNTNKKIMRHSYKTTGYRIQVYTGGNKRADRTKCEQIAARLKTVFPDEPIYVHFYSPSWKCRMGNFTSISEAKTALKQVRRMGYDQACVVKGTISVQY